MVSVKALKSYFNSLGGKVFGTAMISVILFLALLIGFILPRVHTLLMDSKKDGLRHVVESIYSQMEFLAKEAKAGHLSQDEAQSRAKAMAEALRFDGENYVFIHGPGNVMLVLPLARKMEGKGPGELPPAMLAVVKGLDGVAEAAPRGGFWDYAFGKPGKEGFFPKSAYVMRINDWGWIVGAGVYLDDIDSQMRGITLSLLGGALLVAILVAAIAQRRSRRMVRPLHQLVQGLRESDLSRRIAVASLDEIGQAADAFNEYNAKIRSMVVTLGGYTDRLASGATELAATTEQLSATTTEISTGAEQQRVATTQASATLRKVSASIGDVSERVEVANGLSKGSLDMAADGMASARACTQIMGAIQESSSKVSRITHIIANIARQTNLLSLNAAIEAAKAGNQGKGFAVVADEIRKLAERSAGAAKDIADLIQVSSDRVAEGVASAEGVGTCLASIEANIRERADGVVIIAAAMKEDAKASRELADTVGFVAGQTERSASATHELSATILEIARTTEELSAMANQLRSLTAQFQV